MNEDNGAAQGRPHSHGSVSPEDRVQIGQSYSFTEILNIFDLRGPQRRILSREDRDEAVLLSSDEPRTPANIDDSTYAFVGEWPASGPMQLEGSNLAILTKSPRLFLFRAAGALWQFVDRFTYTNDDFRLLLRNGRAERGLVFQLERSIPTDSAQTRSWTPPAEQPAIRLLPVNLQEPVRIASSAFTRAGHPLERQLLLEKALGGHRALIRDLVKAFTTDGVATCVEDPDSIDLLVRWPDGEMLLVEAKTLQGDVVAKLRLAISQLLEYAYRLRRQHGLNPRLAIALDRVPTGSEWLIPYLIDDRALTIIWRTGEDTLLVEGPAAHLLLERSTALAPGQLKR